MSATIIDGKQLAKDIREEIRLEVLELKKEGVTPGLSVILVGEDPASMSYVKGKDKGSEEVGIASQVIRKPATISQQELLEVVQQLNEDPSVHGILVQLPLPKHLSEDLVIQAIDPKKDVDGFHPINVGNMMIGEPCFLPCTPHGVIQMIKRTGIDIAGKHAVVIGRSNIVGKPVSMLLLQEHATVSICHSKTPDLSEITRQADILVVGVGKANMIGAEHVKPGAVVIDVGVNRNEAGKLVGDVRFDEVKEVASYLHLCPAGLDP